MPSSSGGAFPDCYPNDVTQHPFCTDAAFPIHFDFDDPVLPIRV